MKTTYRLIVRRRVEANLRLRLKTPAAARRDAACDDPDDVACDLFDVATAEIAARRAKMGTR